MAEPPTAVLEPLLTADDVATLLRVRPRTLRTLQDAGLLTPAIVAGQRRWTRDAVAAYLTTLADGRES